MVIPHQNVKGLIIAGTSSNIGKTSVTLGLMRLLTRRGLNVSPFKVGPDYIDPGHHSRACGRPSYNLDSFMCPPKYVRNLFSEVPRWTGQQAKKTFRVAIARDEAFAFCYQDTLDAITHYGGEVYFFSPLRDKQLPRDCDWVYLPGGYPELHLKKLRANKAMIQCIRDFGNSGKLIVGECGGMMYLGKSILDEKNHSFPMVGLFNYSTTMNPKRLTLGYRILSFQQKETTKKNFLMKGHEFHYSSFVNNKETPRMQYSNGKKNVEVKDGYVYKNCFAFYSHIYFGSSIEWLKFIINKIETFPSKEPI